MILTSDAIESSETLYTRKPKPFTSGKDGGPETARANR